MPLNEVVGPVVVEIAVVTDTIVASTSREVVVLSGIKMICILSVRFPYADILSANEPLDLYADIFCIMELVGVALGTAWVVDVTTATLEFVVAVEGFVTFAVINGVVVLCVVLLWLLSLVTVMVLVTEVVIVVVVVFVVFVVVVVVTIKVEFPP